MSTRAICVAAAFAIAAIVASAVPATAKDDPAEVKANREAVRKKYKDAKKIPFGDLSFYVDVPAMKETRWEFREAKEPEDVDDPHPMLAATFPSGNASDPTPSIELYVWRSPHSKDAGGGKRSVFSHQFKSWGKSVLVSDVKDMATGHYEDWILEAKDVIKDKCKPSGKKNVGPAEYWGCAVGTDKDAGKRVRRDWYLWVTNGKEGAFTWLAQFTVSDRFIDVDGWPDKMVELMKSIKELKDPKLK